MITQQQCRWAQQIHESNKTSPTLGSAHMTQQEGHQAPASNIVSSLLGANTNMTSHNDTKAILAYVLLKELGCEFQGADKLIEFAKEAPSCAEAIYSELQRLPNGTRSGIKTLTEKVNLDPRSYQQDIKRVYKEFVQHSPNYEPGNPSFGMLISMVVYLVELCRRFLDNHRAQEITSIHNHATRLMLDKETPLSPANWESYMKDFVSRTRRAPGDRPPLERRPSLAAEVISSICYYVDAYAKFTK